MVGFFFILFFLHVLIISIILIFFIIFKNGFKTHVNTISYDGLSKNSMILV